MLNFSSHTIICTPGLEILIKIVAFYEAWLKQLTNLILKTINTQETKCRCFHFRDI